MGEGSCPSYSPVRIVVIHTRRSRPLAGQLLTATDAPGPAESSLRGNPDERPWHLESRRQPADGARVPGDSERRTGEVPQAARVSGPIVPKPWRTNASSAQCRRFHKDATGVASHWAHANGWNSRSRNRATRDPAGPESAPVLVTSRKPGPLPLHLRCSCMAPPDLVKPDWHHAY